MSIVIDQVEQTINFTMRLHFMHAERGDKPRTVEVEGLTFEDLHALYYKERRRRRRGDRCTSAEYRQVLTLHGKAMIASEDDHYNAERYADAINGTWFDWR